MPRTACHHRDEVARLSVTWVLLLRASPGVQAFDSTFG
jgi:hypothetical protein